MENKPVIKLMLALNCFKLSCTGPGNWAQPGVQQQVIPFLADRIICSGSACVRILIGSPSSGKVGLNPPNAIQHRARHLAHP